MGICNDDCDCLVDGDRGILVTGTGDADTPYTVSPDSSRNLTLVVATRDDLPTLTTDDAGTYAYVKDTGITFTWTGTYWETLGPEWFRADFDGVTVNDTETDSIGFVVAGTASFVLFAKGWFDIVVPAGVVSAPISAHLRRTDTATDLDTCLVSVTNLDAAPANIQVPFSLMATIGLATPLDVTGIVVTHIRDAATTSGQLNNGVIFGQRISFLDTTTAFP